MIFPWQQAAWQQLMQMYAMQRLSHAVLLHGPQGTGLTEFALHLAQFLLCEDVFQNNANTACTLCKACHLFESHNHPDLFLLQAEEEGKQIKIDEVRLASEFINKTSQQGGRKVLLVNPAEAMNHFSANALLKTLEEPPANSFIILLSHQTSKLLPTIRSRCLQIKIKQPSKEQTKAYIEQQLSAETSQQILQFLAPNKPLLALALHNEHAHDLYKDLKAIIEQLMNVQSSYVALAAQAIKFDQQIMLQCLLIWISDLVYAINGIDKKIIRDQQMLNLLQNKVRNKNNVIKLYQKVLQTIDLSQQSSNINLQLLCENLFLDWQNCFRA